MGFIKAFLLLSMYYHAHLAGGCGRNLLLYAPNFVFRNGIQNSEKPPYESKREGTVAFQPGKAEVASST